MTSERGGYTPDRETIDITEERIGSLYAALGNNEAKAITFLVMQPNVVYDDSGIVTAVRRAQSNTQKGWRMGNEGPYHYLQKSFAPVGLVALELTDKGENSYGFMRTHWGNAIGDAFAGKMLQLSYNNPDTSLYDIFGSTVSTSKPTDEAEELKKRSPLNRIHLIRELLSSGDRRLGVRDIAGKMGEEDQSLVYRHIKDLARSGIVEVDQNNFVSIGQNKYELLASIVADFQRFVDLDPLALEEGRIFAASLMANPDAVAALMKKAREHSRNANQVPIEVSENNVAAIIESHPGLTTREVRDYLEELYDHPLSEHRVRRIIVSVMDKRGIAWPKKGKSIKWELPRN